MLSCSRTTEGVKLLPCSRSFFSYTETLLPNRELSFRQYGWSGSERFFTVCSSRLLQGTSQTTAFVFVSGKASNIVLIALQAINVLPPAVGTLMDKCMASGTLSW